MSDTVTFRVDKTNLWFALGLVLGAAVGYFFGRHLQ